MNENALGSVNEVIIAEETPAPLACFRTNEPCAQELRTMWLFLIFARVLVNSLVPTVLPVRR